MEEADPAAVEAPPASLAAPDASDGSCNTDALPWDDDSLGDCQRSGGVGDGLVASAGDRQAAAEPGV